MDSPLDVVALDETYILARWQGHVIVLWGQTADAMRAQRVAEETLKAVRAAPRHACHLAWVLPNAGAPGTEARAVFTQMGRDVGTQLACMLAIVGGDGFASAVFRAVITGIAMAARVQFPLKLSPDIQQGAAWVATQTPIAADALVHAFESARARLPVEPSPLG